MIPGSWFECRNDVPLYYRRENRHEVMTSYVEFAKLL